MANFQDNQLLPQPPDLRQKPSSFCLPLAGEEDSSVALKPRPSGRDRLFGFRLPIPIPWLPPPAPSPPLSFTEGLFLCLLSVCVFSTPINAVFSCLRCLRLLRCYLLCCRFHSHPPTHLPPPLFSSLTGRENRPGPDH